MLLDGATTISGALTTALFTGGATADSGASYGSAFTSTESINIVSTIVVEDAHIGNSGNLYAVVVLEDGTLLAKNEEGNFVAVDDGNVSGLPSTETKNLSGANELLILENLVTADLGITDISFSIYVAYSLQSDPTELYFSATPISVNISE